MIDPLRMNSFATTIFLVGCNLLCFLYSPYLLNFRPILYCRIGTSVNLIIGLKFCSLFFSIIIIVILIGNVNFFYGLVDLYSIIDILGSEN